MSPDDENNNFEGDGRSDANHFHIAPEYGEQGEGPGEQPVRRVNSHPSENIDGFNRPNKSSRSIEITEVATHMHHENPARDPQFNHGGNPARDPQFSHGEEDIMQYFSATATEKQRPSVGRPLNDMTGVNSPRRPHPDDSRPLNNLHQPASSPVNNPPHQPSNPAPASPELPKSSPKKKTNLAVTIVIVLITIVIAAVGVFAILIATQNRGATNTVTKNDNSNNTSTEAASSAITCTKSNDEDLLSASDGAQSVKTTVTANYIGKNLDDYSQSSVYTYADEDTAKTARETLFSDYITAYSDLGLTDDPFYTSFAPSKNTVTVKYYAANNDLSFENMTLLNLPQTNGTNPDISAVKKSLTDKGYTCEVKSIE